MYAVFYLTKIWIRFIIVLCMNDLVDHLNSLLVNFALLPDWVRSQPPTHPETTPKKNFGNNGLIWMKLGEEV